MSDPNRPEPPPAPNDRPAVWDLVIEDMLARDDAGLAKYGTRLQPGNGRDALVDAYQEALDLVVYLRQRIEEDLIADTVEASTLARASRALIAKLDAMRPTLEEVATREPSLRCTWIDELHWLKRALDPEAHRDCAIEIESTGSLSHLVRQLLERVNRRDDCPLCCAVGLADDEPMSHANGCEIGALAACMTGYTVAPSRTPTYEEINAVWRALDPSQNKGNHPADFDRGYRARNAKDTDAPTTAPTRETPQVLMGIAGFVNMLAQGHLPSNIQEQAELHVNELGEFFAENYDGWTKVDGA